MRLVLALLALALVPVGSAIFRLLDLALWPTTADSLRYHAQPIATFLHAAGGALFLVLGPLQLLPRSRRTRWHVRAGRIAVGAGLAGALSGLWMTHSFATSPTNPELIYGFRMAFGTAWAAFLILAVMAIRAGNITAHRAHMARALAVAFFGGTSFVLMMAWFAVGGQYSPSINVLIQNVSWMINLAIVEFTLIRRSSPAQVSA